MKSCKVMFTALSRAEIGGNESKIIGKHSLLKQLCFQLIKIVLF